MGRAGGNGGELKRSPLQPFLKNTPAGAIKVQDLEEVSPLVKEEVEMPIGGFFSHAADVAGQGVERAAQVDGADDEEDTEGGRTDQHAPNTPSSRRKLSGSKSVGISRRSEPTKSW